MDYISLNICYLKVIMKILSPKQFSNIYIYIYFALKKCVYLIFKNGESKYTSQVRHNWEGKSFQTKIYKNGSKALSRKIGIKQSRKLNKDEEQPQNSKKR